MSRTTGIHRPRKVGESLLVTRVAAGYFLHRSPDYLRQIAQPIACDVDSRVVLYDYDELAQLLSRRVA